MSMRRAALLLALVIAPAALSCRGCREEGPEDVRALVSKDAGAVFVLDGLGAFMRDVDGFVKRATRSAGAKTVQRLRQSFQQQFAFDPLDPASLDGFGVDTTRGVALFTEAGQTEPLLVLGVRDRATFDRALEALIEKTDGASKFEEEKVGARTLRVAGRPFGNEVAPAMHWTHVGRFAVVGRADARPALEAMLARLDAAPKSDAGGSQARAPSILDDALFGALTGKLPKGDGVVFVRAAAAEQLAGASAEGLSKGAVTGFDVSESGVKVDSFIDLELGGLEDALGGAEVSGLAARVGADAVLVGLSRAARPGAIAVLRKRAKATSLLDRALAPLGDAIGVDPEKDVLPLLAGPLTASLHVTELAGLPAALQKRKFSTLLDYVAAVVTAEVTDKEAMLAVLERSRVELGKRGVKLERRSLDVGNGKKAIVFGAAGVDKPKLAWGLVDDVYVYAAGAGRLERALRVVAGASEEATLAGKLATPAAADLVGEAGASVLILRGAELAAAASSMQAPGSGTIGAVIGGAVELVRTLGDVAVAVDAEQGGLRLRVREVLR